MSAPQEKEKEKKELALPPLRFCWWSQDHINDVFLKKMFVATTQTQGFTSLANKNCETCKDQLSPSAEDFISIINVKMPPPAGPTQW